MPEPQNELELNLTASAMTETPLATAPSAKAIDPDAMHDLFEGTSGPYSSDEEDPLAALRNDPNYAALIKDLEYIASQARLLFAPSQEAPSEGLWDKIQSQMAVEDA